MTIDLDGLEQEAYERGRKEGLAERAVLQRRIRNQRRELRWLNALLRGKDLINRTLSNENARVRSQAYQHAAQLAQTFWFGGRRIANYIRQWS